MRQTPANERLERTGGMRTWLDPHRPAAAGRSAPIR